MVRHHSVNRATQGPELQQLLTIRRSGGIAEKDPGARIQQESPTPCSAAVRWCDSIFITARNASAVENTPPLANGKVPQESEVLAYLSSRIAEVDGDCTLKEAQRVFYCFAAMKTGSPIVFDRATRLWRGRRHAL
jgi:hypothetical protein